MVDEALVSEVESFVRSFGYFYVDGRDGYIQVKGTFDDLDPEPEREEVDNSLHKMRRAFLSEESPIEVEKVSDVESRYGAKLIRVYPE